MLCGNGFGEIRGWRRCCAALISAAISGHALLFFLRPEVLDARVGEPLPCGIGRLSGRAVDSPETQSYPQGRTAGDNFPARLGTAWAGCGWLGKRASRTAAARPGALRRSGLVRLSNG
ncbi:hypothetical protein GCM10009565_89290 [Amycolatopsis albidoflavus]